MTKADLIAVIADKLKFPWAPPGAICTYSRPRSLLELEQHPWEGS